MPPFATFGCVVCVLPSFLSAAAGTLIIDIDSLKKP